MSAPTPERILQADNGAVPLSTFLGLVSNDDPYKTRYFRICGSTRTLRQNIRKGYLVVKLLSERISRKRGDVPRMEEMLTDTIRANNVLMGYLDHYEAYVRAVQRVPMVSREGWRMARRHEEAVLTVGLLGKDEKVREIGEAVDVVDRGMCDSTKLEKRGAKKS